MAGTVLSSYSVGGFARAQLLAQLGELYTKKATDKSTAIGNRYTADINSVDAEKNRWQSAREDIQAGRSTISTTVAHAKTILASIDRMIQMVNKAAQNTEGFTGYEMYSSTFDSFLKQLDNSATKSDAKPNLLGTFKTQLSYRVGINGTTTTINSAYVGSTYYIIDSEGKYWDVDRSANILKRYDDYPDTPTSVSGNFQSGLRLDSLDGDAITFTVGPDAATPETFTGTLYRKGLHILDSWAYDGLSTDEGRQRALEDLNDAKAAIDLEIRRYQVAFTTSNFYDTVATQSISGLTKKTNQLMLDQAAEIQKEQQSIAREYQTASNAVVRSISMQNQYAKLLNPLFQDKARPSLISIWT